MGVLYARVAGAWVAIPAGPVGPEGPMGPPALSNSVYVATTGNIALSGSPTIDNVVVPAGMRVLVKNQTDITQNGIYISAAGSWTRAPDMDQGSEVHGTTVYVEAGAQQNNTLWAVLSPAQNDTGFVIGQGILFTRIGAQPPAYVGEWRTAAGTTDGNMASFSSFANNNLKEGYTVDLSGYCRIYSRTGVKTGATQIQFIEVAADHVTEQWIASLIRNRWQVADICFGQEPNHGLWGVWIASSEGNAGRNYMMMRGGSGELYLNADPSSYVSLRVGNGSALDVRPGQTSAAGQFQAAHNPGNSTWTSAQFLANCTSSSAEQARVAGNSPGVAPQLRVVATNGERWGVVNSDASVWAPIGASGFETNSSVATKREVRHLGERERIIVNHPVDADVVPPIDVMSLRPVAFRPKIGAQRIVPTNGVSYSPDDDDSWRIEPEVGILGHEGQRERLGLIAEEVHTVLPSAVNHDVDGNALGIDYAQITVALLDHVQRLTEEVATLRYRITELEGEA